MGEALKQALEEKKEPHKIALKCYQSKENSDFKCERNHRTSHWWTKKFKFKKLQDFRPLILWFSDGEWN